MFDTLVMEQYELSCALGQLPSPEGWAQTIFVITANHVNWGLSLIGQVNRSIKK